MSFDALVVLGCRVHGHLLSHTAERRVERAALAYREQGAGLVIASGGRAWYGVPEAETFAAALVERGVPRGCLLEERSSLSTRENARSVAKLLRERSIGKLGLVTCDWHMPRALALFRHVGLNPTPVPAPSPPAARAVSWLREGRERASLAFDLLLGPTWSRR